MLLAICDVFLKFLSFVVKSGLIIFQLSPLSSDLNKWFDPKKGFGFIEPEDGGKDVFVHISAVEASGLAGLEDNQKVTYELQEGRDGRQMAGDLKAV